MLGILNQFKHKQEMRESKDEILVGEIVRAMARLGCPAYGFATDITSQSVRFKPKADPVLHSIIVRVDRKTGGSMLGDAIMGSKAVLTFQAEVKNLLADPDDLIHMYRTDLQNIFKMPMMGDVRLDHQLNSILATKKVFIDLDQYILKGDEGVARTTQLIQQVVSELKGKLAPYKKA
jgi:hypothetical protein